MLSVLHLLLGLWLTILGSTPTPVVPPVPTSAPVGTFFQANGAALVHTDAYRRDRQPIASCGLFGPPDGSVTACAGRDGLVVWRRGVRLQPSHRGFRT